ASLPIGLLENSCFTYGNSCVEFIAIDQLIKKPSTASLVLVDEAAAVPVYLLEELATHNHRMVFASTVHGYEGAGRGFTLKFQQKLTIICPNWRSLHIKQPIRYREQDPLEQLIFEACMLNAELDDLVCKDSALLTAGTKSSIETLDVNSLTFNYFSASMLAADEALLAQVVSVLVTAHYQTKPSDVKMLLDNPHVQVLCLLANINQRQQVIAVAMLMREGCSGVEQLTKHDIQSVSNSKRRLTNQFTPQSLLTQCGVEQAFDFYYLRVMRIAVHVQLQHQGIGGHLLTHIDKFAQSQGADFIASSFGATKSLLSFWLTHNYYMARLGFTKDKASGEHSALVLKAVSPQAFQLESAINHEFYRSFDYLLVDEYQGIAADLIALIQHYCPKALQTELTAHDIAAVTAFVQGHRQYSCCVLSLHLWLKKRLFKSNLAEQAEIMIFIKRIMQKHSIAELCKQHDFTGKKALEQFLRANI
ncbi:MAG: GNAT family N-acetyltransferase, partial [Colwellia sp.]|nr:GNAT family N-acetyltransferase [Colwellia sp.]